jgi:threonyl-tRNA synthetase
VGEEEMTNSTVSVRNYKTKTQEVEELEDFVKRSSQEYKNRKLN